MGKLAVVAEATSSVVAGGGNKELSGAVIVDVSACVSFCCFFLCRVPMECG